LKGVAKLMEELLHLVEEEEERDKQGW